MGWRIEIQRRLKRFGKEDKGSVTLQVIFFSLLLLATTGLVLDSGRLYTQHSQMQAFTDQMALAAASELDGQDDAITRAVDAVFGANGNGPYMGGGGIEIGQYQVRSLLFYDSMQNSNLPQNDMSGAFPGSALVAEATLSSSGSTNITYFKGNATEASNAAVYAMADAIDRGTKSAMVGIATTILSLGNAVWSDELGPNGNNQLKSHHTFAAVSAASLDKLSCADLSPLVFCNPWEDISPSPLETPKDDSGYSVPGRSLQYFAPNFNSSTFPGNPTPILNGQSEVGSVYPWDVNHQLFKLQNPLVDAAGICDSSNVPRISLGEDYAAARDRCLMARAQSDTVCWSGDDDLTMAPAHGPDVSRALNTIFDIWMPPFDTAIQTTSDLGTTGMPYYAFFEPDRLATTLWESADWDGHPADFDRQALTATEEQDGVYEYESPLAQYTHYLGHTGPDFGLSINGVYAIGIGYDVCHANNYSDEVTGTPNGGACTHDFIGDHYEGNGATTTNRQTYMSQYWRNMYNNPVDLAPPGQPANVNFCGGVLEQNFGLGEYCEVAALPTEVDTWYKLYQRERQLQLQITTDTSQSRVNVWNDDDDDANIPNYVARYGLSDQYEKYLKQFPDHFYADTSTSTLFLPAKERRVLRSPLVNCAAVTAQGVNNAGVYEIGLDDLRIVDIYLSTPPGHYCGPNIAACDVDASRETILYTELIEDLTDELVLQRYTAHLVR